MNSFNKTRNRSTDHSQQTSEVDPLGAQASSRKIRGRSPNSRRARLNGEKKISPIPVLHSLAGLVPFSDNSTSATGIAACGQSKAPGSGLALTTPDRRRSTDPSSNPVPRWAEPSGARSTSASSIVPPRESVASRADRTPWRRGWRTRRPERLPSRVGFRPQVGCLEQRTLLSALPTLTALIASTAAAGPGQSVTFTATVSDLTAGGATPSGGTVTFSDQNGPLASETLSNGVATFTTASLAVGTYTVTASYGGTAAFAPSTTGTIVTAAGAVTGGYSGNNGPATDAELDDPAASPSTPRATCSSPTRATT